MKLAPILSIWGVGVVSGDLERRKSITATRLLFSFFLCVFLLNLTQRGQFRATLCGEFSALSSQIMEDYICMTWLESKYLVVFLWLITHFLLFCRYRNQIPHLLLFAIERTQHIRLFANHWFCTLWVGKIGAHSSILVCGKVRSDLWCRCQGNRTIVLQA